MADPTAEVGTRWSCVDCGWSWPLTTRPPDGAECDNCGGDLEADDA